MSSAVGIIPVRYESTRFPGKPLIDLEGKSMIERVWEGARSSRLLETVVIATPDAIIAEHARSFGASVVLTPDPFPSGSDRVAWVARHYFPYADIIVNIQGDEPLITGDLIDQLTAALRSIPGADVATLIEPINATEAVTDPSVVKVVCNQAGYALYFSRAPIPYTRAIPARPYYYKHIGIYAFRSSILQEFVTFPPSPLERIEGLEQLRLLENGKTIFCIESPHPLIGVDTPEDAVMVREFLRQRQPPSEEPRSLGEKPPQM